MQQALSYWASPSVPLLIILPLDHNIEITHSIQLPGSQSYLPAGLTGSLQTTNSGDTHLVGL